METKNIKWKDISIGDKFVDGSIVTQIHPIHKYPCYKLKYTKKFHKYFNLLNNKLKEITISNDHLIMCDLKYIKEPIKSQLYDLFKDKYIPISANYDIYTNESLSEKDKKEIISFLTGKQSDNLNVEYVKSILDKTIIKQTNIDQHPVIQDDKIWLNGDLIHHLVNIGVKIVSNGEEIVSSLYVGIKEAMCVATTTGKYITKGLIHHNSVTLRDIIFHCLTHNHDITIGLVDLKLTEFTQFKGMNGVVGVANSVQEAVELLRVARAVMYKRNADMAKLGLTDIKDFKPKEPTDKIWISGREFQEDTILKVKIDGEEKEMSAKEILEYVNG